MADLVDEEFFGAAQEFHEALLKLLHKSLASAQHEEFVSAAGALVVSEKFVEMLKIWTECRGYIQRTEEIYQDERRNEIYRKLRTEEERIDFLNSRKSHEN